jgi:septum formation protein
MPPPASEQTLPFSNKRGCSSSEPKQIAVRFILASASPRRRQLLAEAGYDFRVIPARVIETAPLYLTAGETALFNARAKAETVAAEFPDELVVGVDTLVSQGREIFGKPASLAAAETMLHRLMGRAHEVFSGVWLVQRQAGRRRGFIEGSRVHLRDLSRPQLKRYLRRIDPLDKAGGYAAQEDAGELIEKIDGSLTNVIGLPMEQLRTVLRDFEQFDFVRSS